jgi:hypothetical protein
MKRAMADPHRDLRRQELDHRLHRPLMSTIEELGSFLAREGASAARIGATSPVSSVTVATNGAEAPADAEITPA